MPEYVPAGSGSNGTPLRSASTSVSWMVKGRPERARTTAATVSPPVLGTRAEPLRTKLCRRSTSVGPSLASSRRSSRYWNGLMPMLPAIGKTPLVFPRERESV